MDRSSTVVYQIYPKSFCDASGDGWGDIQGVISRLDYLQELGINCIWFNPMCISPQKDNGYDVQDYRNIDPRYGTMADFEQLVAECRKRGIDIMLDMVFNHTSTKHEWFQKALQGDPKYKAYYIWKKGKGLGVPPNNWQSKFGGPAWEYVPKFDEWYLHLFDVSQADLDWTNPAVRKEMADIVNFWMKKGVHGFRFDVINEISKSSFEDDPNNFDGRQFYTDQPLVHTYLKELNENSFGNDPEAMTVGEMSSTTVKNCSGYAGDDSHELSSVFSFHHLKVDYKDGKKWELQPFDFMQLKHLLNEWQVGMQENHAWNALFWNCHDQPRSVSRFGNDTKYRKESAKMLAAAIHLMRGTPYIYMGEEIGMPNAGFDDISQYRDVESINAYHILQQEGKSEQEILHILNERSRDNARTPMCWDSSEKAGFTTGTPWIPLGKTHKEINVENDRKDPESIFAWYQKLISLRKSMKIIEDGTYVPMLEKHPSVLAYQRIWKNEKLTVLCNFYGTQTQADLDDTAGSEILLTNVHRDSIDAHMTLQPYECLVLYKK
ncbi:MAG: alpha,alpha-phosphotrehalase [Erysipelotrichaceae bacterium]|nr:alpha,alpha-phosphotrehalase [Erysipelotrichaceae bacterium]